MQLSDRKKKILAAIVESYVESAEPVGSKTIAQTSGLGLSSATIRNEMAELTNLGYLEQPHTSAGRIPSALGYRIYVNSLMRRHKLSIEESEHINNSLRQRLQQLDDMISDIGKLASSLTNYPAYALAAATNSVTVRRFDFIFVEASSFIIVLTLSNNSTKSKLVPLPYKITEDELLKLSTAFNMHFTGVSDEDITPQLIASVEFACGDNRGLVSAIAAFVISSLGDANGRRAYIAGTSNILQLPEYQDIGKAQRLMSYLSDPGKLIGIPAPDDNDAGIKIMIGPENVADELKDSSVVVASCDLGEGTQGLFGVVGPTRMDYSKVAARLSFIANGLSRLLRGQDNALSPPEDHSE